MPICVNCGAKVEDSDKFCRECGTAHVVSDQQKTSPTGSDETRIAVSEANTSSSLNLKQNIESFLCYVGVWVTGIIFLILERKNQVVRFHAAQSLVVFGFLAIISLFFGFIPVVGAVLSWLIGTLIFILWIVLMVKVYQGELYRVPVASDIADGIVGVIGEYRPKDLSSSKNEANVISSNQTSTDLTNRTRLMRAGRITAYSFSIAWDFALIIFLNFFNQYIAYFHLVKVNGADVWIREPIITSDFSKWLPIATTFLGLSILGYVGMIIIDSYLVRQVIRISRDILAIWAIGTLIAIFPFDFSVLPASSGADMQWVLPLILGLVIFGLSIAVIVRLVRLILYAVEPRRYRTGHY